ncbi:hypothetical protein PYCCODRAFT_1434639 [Trametes coccinea BRFM310]|uniref:Uncharacterized protein n=1 Tax=Trametes coccinea (strain BRFM310) TaxID=1353009 RepID=A0A1Y2ISP1_TRAC3|nr:hypothetical protein PYCCODRAFT_1434639 [Trametes coccinea BRFM310]
MAEAGPSSSSIQSDSRPVTPNSSPPRRASRIRFPNDQSHGNSAENRQYGSFQALGLGPPPSLTGRAGNADGSLVFSQDEKRRRVRSVDGVDGVAQTRPKDPQASTSMSRRTVSLSRRGEQRDKYLKGLTTGLTESFSNEYDLSREDPAILEDVQRALRLKARREARLRTLQSSPIHSESRGTPEIASVSSISAASSPAAAPGPNGTSFPRQTALPGDSEVDFSPATGPSPLHPVPTSSDGGVTLDWGPASVEDARERRWSISITKRKGKEPALASSKDVIEKQESLYVDKLQQIRARAKPHTIRKAAITSDQLGRRYRFLLSKSNTSSVNLLDVVRWYRKQEEHVKETLDKMEPATWMKHLWDKHGAPKGGNSSWSPTALVIEEYVKFHTSPHTMSTIPEDDVALPSSPNAPSFSEARSPSTSSYSWTSPRHSLEPAISRKRSSYDAQVSFEPHVESGKESIGPRSRHSTEGFSRNWRSTAAGGDSARSSLYSLISKGASPNSSRKHLRGLSKRLGRRRSDDALSSARNSTSEQSASEDGHRGHQKMATLRPSSRPTSLHLQSGDEETSARVGGIHSAPSAGDTLRAEASEEPATATQSTTIFSRTPEATPRTDKNVAGRSTLPRRRYRTSLPSSRDLFVKEREKQRRAADEQKEREEYEIKAQVLEDTLSQNYRIRHLLQRIAAGAREYDSVQGGLSDLLHIPYPRIPPEVMDAFIHDPSAVTGGTRRVTGWKAVEDIHARIQRQRETLQSFLRSQLGDSCPPTPTTNVFEDQIKAVIQSLEQLASQREVLTNKAEEVATALKRVKAIQATVKKDYNDTLAHTSLVYPELSQIAALEENYRNHYQQFWDIGLDALTLLLDTVTPFWRNYGKVIGEDVQDFLIIPWYRNEFTGEPKRYPIKRFPRRSFRHWVGLLCLSFLSVVVTLLQTRAAISMTMHFNLPWISNTGLRWILTPVYTISLIITWCAVLVEYCILLAQSGVVIWWLGWTVNLFT